VGLVIEAILERQEVLHFFRSLLLAHESEERRRLNEELEKMSHTDSLSGLANRRSFDDALDDEWERMKRERQPLSLLFVDVDHFKRYNDAYGHREGDACLRAVGRSLAACSTRPSDLAARYGGEEFVLLLPNTDARTAQNIAERVLEAVDALNIPHVDSPTAEHVTVSVGVASAPVGTGREARHLVETADACLYRAKNEGRHRICLSELRGDSIRPRPTRTSAIALK
jgi:diguanylate cyclase (GGDEF)-like protein